MLASSLSLPACLPICQACRPKSARSRTQPWSRVSSRQIACGSYVGDYRDSQEYKDENPGFDDLVLDAEYFAKMGIDLKQFTKDIASSVSDIDPEGMNLTPEMFAELSDSGNADFVREQAEGVDIWGPEVRTRHLSCSPFHHSQPNTHAQPRAAAAVSGRHSGWIQV